MLVWHTKKPALPNTKTGRGLSTAFLCFLTVLYSVAWAGAKPLAQTEKTVRLPTVLLPKTSLSPDELGVIVNDADPLSVEIAHYYQARRGIPDENMIHVRFAPGATIMNEAQFDKIKARVDAKTPSHVQAFALTWTKPYRVGCMSITTAFAAGFDKTFCATGCAPTRRSSYFNSTTSAPYTQYKLRPAMSLAGRDFGEVKKLIDRGVLSDTTFPSGTGYLLNTTDRDRNVRAGRYGELAQYMEGTVKLQTLRTNFIEDKPDVLFYFTGTAQVPKLDSNTFVPGAIADHLTSAGGQLTDSTQMSSLRWLEAGATGSYGAVIEPCNYPEKFPNAGILISHYIQGETLIEAYWKSVAMPGQGIFIGEPLAKPYGGYKASSEQDILTLRTYALKPGSTYTLLGADSGIGPYHVVARNIHAGRGMLEIKLKNANKRFYSIVPAGSSMTQVTDFGK